MATVYAYTTVLTWKAPSGTTRAIVYRFNATPAQYAEWKREQLAKPGVKGARVRSKRKVSG